MATSAQIQQTIAHLAAVTTEMPVLRVPLADLPLWIEHLYADEMTVAVRYDGRVQATVTRYFPELGLLVVDALADVVKDLDLPPCPEGKAEGESVRLPASDVWRLESSGDVQKGVA